MDYQVNLNNTVEPIITYSVISSEIDALQSQVHSLEESAHTMGQTLDELTEYRHTDNNQAIREYMKTRAEMKYMVGGNLPYRYLIDVDELSTIRFDYGDKKIYAEPLINTSIPAENGKLHYIMHINAFQYIQYLNALEESYWNRKKRCKISNPGSEKLVNWSPELVTIENTHFIDVYPFTSTEEYRVVNITDSFLAKYKLIKPRFMKYKLYRKYVERKVAEYEHQKGYSLTTTGVFYLEFNLCR